MSYAFLVEELARLGDRAATAGRVILAHLGNGTSMAAVRNDMRDLLALEAHDPRAAEAVELFCYQARKWIGSFAAALGGLDTWSSREALAKTRMSFAPAFVKVLAVSVLK